MPPGERNRAAQALPAPGQVIGGKYEIVRMIGEGGMGIVFEAKHLRLRQRVAVKMLLPDMLAHDVIVSRFEREARASGQLRNRHTVRVIDVETTAEGLPYMVMEYLEGHDLQTELDLRDRLPLEEAVRYVLQACSAMAEAHQLGIVHRDLKPANLFLAHESDASDSAGARLVKVLDFGISKVGAEADAKLTVADSVIGTAMYMSPEQVRSSGEVDARTDIWALGIILFELLAGRPPWTGSPTQLAAWVVSEDAPDVRTCAPDVPPEVAAIIARALRRDPRERYDDVRQLAAALGPYAPSASSGVPSSARFAQARVGSAAAPHVSIHPARLEEANTVLQAPAVSQSRVPGDAAGTTPGWTQGGEPQTRGRTLLLGFVVAFVLGLIVVGGVATAWLRRGGQATVVASGVTTGASVPALASGAPSAPEPTVAPAPAPLPIAVGVAPASSAGGAASRIDAAPRARVAPRVAPNASAPPTVVPNRPAAPSPVVTPTSNPLHL